MKEMSNVLKDVQLLEKDLMRDLTNEEIAAVINKGWEKFLAEDLNINNDSLKTLRKAKDILSAFYSCDEDTYYATIEDDVRDVYLLFKRLTGDLAYQLSPNAPCCYSCGVTDKGPEAPYKSEEKECSRKDYKPCSIKSCSGEEAGGDYDLDKAVYDVEYYGKIADTMSRVFDALPSKDSKWLKEYIKMDPDYAELVAYVTDYVGDPDGNFEGLCSDVSDHIKDTVIKGIADKLIANKGKAIVLDTEILDEVFDYLLITNQNIKVRAVNNQITVL